MADLFDIEVFLITLTVGSFGFICSVISLCIIYKRPLLHNAYGYICAASSAFEGIVLLIFILWTSTIIFIDKELGKRLFGLILGFIKNFLYYNAQYLHLLKSINRFMAIVFFVKYRTFFTNNVTKMLIVIVSIISFVTIIPFFWYKCNYLFNTQFYVWDVRNEECGIGIFVDIISITITLFTSLLCDIITFLYLHFGVHKNSSSTLKHDIRFLIQAFITSLFYLVMMLTFHVFSHFVESPLMTFMTSSFAWILCHTLNQLTFILFTVGKKANSNVTTVSAIVPSSK